MARTFSATHRAMDTAVDAVARGKVATAPAATTFVAATAAIAAAQHLHLLGDDVDRVALDAVLVGVLAVLQAPLDVDRLALL